MAKKKGGPSTSQERHQKSYKHNVQYGLKMTVRRDVGGQMSITQRAKMFSNMFRDKSVEEIGEAVAQMEIDLLASIRKRQSHTLEHLHERAGVLEEATNKAISLLNRRKCREGLEYLIRQNTDYIHGKGAASDPTHGHWVNVA